MREINLNEDIETRLQNLMKELRNIMIEIEEEYIVMEGTVEIQNHTVKQVLNCTLEVL